MFNGLQVFTALLIAGSLAMTHTPAESAEKEDAGQSESWKLVPSEDEIGPNEEVQSEESLQEQETNEQTKSPTQQVKLTENQIQELDQIISDLIEKRKELIDKYVEFGVVPKEKAEEIKSHMDAHYERMKEENFVPKPPKHMRDEVPSKNEKQQ